MKKIYTLAGAMAFLCTGAFAQNHVVVQHSVDKLVKAKKTPVHFNDKQTFPDTLGFDTYTGGSYYGYGTLNGSSGYFCGTNWDSVGNPGNENGEFVGYYNLGDNYNVTDIIGICFHKNYPNGGGTSKIIGSVQLMNDTTTLSAPTTVSYPSPSSSPYTVGQSLVGDTGSITLASIDTANALFDIHLSTPAHITPSSGDWGVFVDFSDCYNNGDTIGLSLAEPVGLSSYTDTTHLLVWYYNTNYFWVPTYLYLSSSYGAGIFAVVEDGTGINHYDGKGLKMYQNAPNPSNGNTTINYRLKNTGMAHFRVLSSTGKVVYEESGTREAGVTNKVVFHQGQLAAGIYFYQLNANGETLTMKMVITK